MNTEIPYYHIAIEGVIGAGKTTLAEALNLHLPSQLILEEFADNSFLEKFYQDKEGFAFPLEVSFLVERFNQLEKALANRDLFYDHIISDYFFDKSYLFAQNNLVEDKLRLFNQVYLTLKRQIQPPNLLIYLYNSIDNLKGNILKRGRNFEQNIEYQYLEDMQNLYMSYIKVQTEYPIIILNVTEVDFRKDSTSIEEILKMLKTPYPNGVNFLKI